MSASTSTKYVLQPANVKVVFYDRHSDYRGKIITYCNLTRLHHCGIIFTMGDESILLMSDKTHRAKFVDTKRFHERFFQPTKEIYMGEANVSIQQLTDYVRSMTVSNAKNISFWYFISRHFFKTLRPNTCALLVSQILRMCGWCLPDCITPKQLYRELITYAVDSNCRTGGSG